MCENGTQRGTADATGIQASGMSSPAERKV
jgi:hypothetical protein